MYLFFAALLSMSLFSFHVADPGMLDVATGRPVLNMAGLVGSWLAAFFVGAVGLGAWFFPAVLMWRGVSRLSTKIRLTMARGCGFWGFFLACVNLLSHPWFTTSRASSYGMFEGGLVGRAMVNFGLPFLKEPGLFLLWLVVLLGSLHLFLDISWLAVMQRLGVWLHECRLQYQESRKRRQKLKTLREEDALRKALAKDRKAREHSDTLQGQRGAQKSFSQTQTPKQAQAKLVELKSTKKGKVRFPSLDLYRAKLQPQYKNLKHQPLTKLRAQMGQAVYF